MIGVSGVSSDEADSTELSGEEDHLVGRLWYICLEHESLLDLVQDRLWLVEGSAVDTSWARVRTARFAHR